MSCQPGQRALPTDSKTRTSQDATFASHIACKAPRVLQRGRLPRWVCGTYKQPPGRSEPRPGLPNFQAPCRIPAKSGGLHCRKGDEYSDTALLQLRHGHRVSQCNVKYFPRIPAEYHRSAIPNNMRQMPIKNTEVRLHDIAAWGKRKESEKSKAIPVHQRTTIRVREPLSWASAEPAARFTLHAITSGSIHDAHVPQKIRA